MAAIPDVRYLEALRRAVVDAFPNTLGQDHGLQDDLDRLAPEMMRQGFLLAPKEEVVVAPGCARLGCDLPPGDATHQPHGISGAYCQSDICHPWTDTDD